MVGTSISTTVTKWHCHTGPNFGCEVRQNIQCDNTREGLQHRDGTFTTHFSLAAAVCQDVSTN